MGTLQIAVLSSFVAIGAAVYYIATGVVRQQKRARDRLAVYGRRGMERNPVRGQEIRQPFSDRAIAPVVERVGSLVGRYTPAGWIDRTEHRLQLAGHPGDIDANGWAVIKVFSVAGSALLWLLIVGSLNSTIMRAVALAGLLIFGFFGPDAWLNRRIEERSRNMLRQLPDILDLMVISVEAGMGFDAALGKVVQTVPGELSDEFHRMLQETRVGVSRRQAMQHLRDRVAVDEVRSFLLAMMQADNFGVPIARVLRVQADEMRIKRRQAAQEKAFAAPVKMVFPLILLVGAFLAILLGPAGISIFDNLINR